MPRHTGGPWLAPLSGRFSLYVLDARCVVCGSAEDPRRFAFQRAAADVRLELSRPVVLRVGPDGIGRGSIALRSGTSEPIVLVDLSRHCALRQSLALPLHIGAETVELPLEWNARNPVELPRQPFLFHDPDGVVGMCRIELTWDVEPPRVAPARLRFANSRSIEVTVEGGGFHISAVETADAPPCLRVGSFVRKGSRWTAAVHEERMARERHSCGAWILHLISPAGEPFERRLGVEHDPRMQGPEGEPSLFARLTPGERIWILRRSDGTLGLAMPERLPCIDETMLRESRVIADFTAPVDTGRFAATVGTPEGAVAIAGVVQGAEEALQLGWWKLAGVTVLR